MEAKKPISTCAFYQKKQRRRGRCVSCGKPALAEYRCRRHFIRWLLRRERIVVGMRSQPLDPVARALRDRLVASLSRRFTRVLKTDMRPVSLGGALMVACNYQVPEDQVPALARCIRSVDRLAVKRRAPR